MPDIVGWILALSALIGAVGVIWKSAIKPAAKAIATREVVAPVLSAISQMRPPLEKRLDDIEKELRELKEHLKGGE